jgi:CubicO group peptidase (beta-lactamase class C family)
VDGVRLLEDRTLDDATRELVSGPDEVILASTRFGSGFMLNSSVAQMLSESSFGHTGAGGALGFADRAQRVGFGYVQNQLVGGMLGDPRTAGLIEALRACLGA